MGRRRGVGGLFRAEAAVDQVGVRGEEADGDAEYKVLKNTLARRAVKGTPFEKLSDQMVGPLMYGIATDPVAGAKVIAEFAKENELFVIKGGAMANTKMSDKDVKALALLPSREELIA